MARHDNEVANVPEQTVTLADFCSAEKLNAFCDYYQPADYDGDGVEMFTDARLREFFKAVPCQCGDPLSLYLQQLAERGFKMRVSVTGEPAIFANVKLCN